MEDLKYIDMVELRQGSYWQSTVDVEDPENRVKHDFKGSSRYPVVIPKGSVLLLQSIRDIDQQAHTIILRPHPSVIGQTVLRQSEHHADAMTWGKLEEHRLLVADFLRAFTLVANPEPIRSKELAGAQQRITDLQRKLLDGQSNPEVLGPVLALGIGEWEKEKGLTPERAEHVATMSTSTALAPSLTEEHVENLKLRADREHRLATTRAGWIKERVAEINEAVQAIVPYMEEQAAAALAQTEDIIRSVTSIQRTVSTLDLYIGKDVTVETLATGGSAPPDVPLTVMQRKLFMQEEFAVWAEVGEDFDYRDDAQFLKALTQNESLRRQLFATERSILCMATRRTEKDYGDPWVNANNNPINKEVFLLVQDGGNLYRIFSPVESHLRALQLFPSRGEADAIFSGVDGTDISFMDTRYTDRTAKHEMIALSYKRFLVLMAGLDHRLNLFGTFYEGPKSQRFVSMEFQRRNMRFVHDVDGDGMLPLPDRPSLRQWIKQNNAYLRPGSRVMCLWDVLANPRTAPGMAEEREKAYHGYDMKRTPVQRRELQIVTRSLGELVVYATTVSGYYLSDNKRRVQSRVEISKWTEGYYKKGLGFLVLDAIKADDLDFYIHDRDSRIDFDQYIDLFKETLAYLRKEETQQAPARAALRQALDEGEIGDDAGRDAVVDTTIRGWRADNRGAELPPSSSGKGWLTLLNTMYTITAAPGLVGMAVSRIAGLAADPLRFVVTGSDEMFLYASPLPEQRDDRIVEHTWVHRFLFTRQRYGKVKMSEPEWVMLPPATASETTIQEWPEAVEWANKRSCFPSFKEKQRMMSCPSTEGVKGSPWLAASVDSEAWDAMFGSWRAVYRKQNEDVGHVKQMRIWFPIGVRVNTQKHDSRVVYAAGQYPEARLWHLAPDEDRKKLLLDAYCSLYRSKSHGATKFQEHGREGNYHLSLVHAEVDAALFPAPDSSFKTLALLGDNDYGSVWSSKDMSLDFQFERSQKYIAKYKSRYKVPYVHMALHPDLDGKLDEVFGHYTGPLVTPELKPAKEDDDEDDEE